MTSPTQATLDGNEAAASVAYRASEVIAIYPITPASPMGELSDTWSSHGRPNLWGAVPEVMEMQSEGGAAGAVHGALQAGALSATFTASQGLLLMIPNMYKIAGELTPFCMHVAARALATHALSIFGDHSDVMACRQTGFALLASASVQEAHDLAAVAHAATLQARVPFLHFFDGFRTSHELQKIELLSDEALLAMLSATAIAEHRRRALTPDHPALRGTAQNPDVFFQAREAANPFYDRTPAAVTAAMERLAALCGRRYRLFDYVGHPEAEEVFIAMGSGTETIEERLTPWLTAGRRVGLLKVRLYRPFAVEAFVEALPASTRRITVLDRTKEPGAVGDPLYLDVVTALAEAWEGAHPGRALPAVVGGRYGLGSKEFTPAMVDAMFANLAAETPRNHFTVGITDDVTLRSLTVDPVTQAPRLATATAEEDEEHRALLAPGRTRPFEALFFGLGSDGTVGANKNTLKILGSDTDFTVQGYFVYDSKKAGAVTVSHLRVGREPIRAPYLVEQADFVACHSFPLLEVHEIAEKLRPGGALLLNVPCEADEAWDRLPSEVQDALLAKEARLFVIDARAIADRAGLGRRINTVMQTCFFALTELLENERALGRIKDEIAKTYGKLGNELVRRNVAAVDGAIESLFEIPLPRATSNAHKRPPAVPPAAPDFVRNVTAVMMAGKGDLLPTSAFPPDGTWPTGTAKWEKRSIATEIPVWDAEVCVQCNLCVLLCPHAAIRAKVTDAEAFAQAPKGLDHVEARAAELKGAHYVLQTAPEDCTGCRLCVEVCPARNKAEPRRKAINMEAQAPILARERERWDFFLELPTAGADSFARMDARTSQYMEPLFEYSGACAGCGETPYIKLLTQLFGDRALIANATGCSSIYGGNLPTTPYTTNADGRGPAWSNSLFEDNAEFGLGMRLALDQQAAHARELLDRVRDIVPADLQATLLAPPTAASDPATAAGELAGRRRAVDELRALLTGRLREEDHGDVARLLELVDHLVAKSVWIVGGDGWAYDIGYGGLDHVLASDRNINVLVLDTEVYSNTGGQQSKATPLGAAAKFAAAGKTIGKKDLAMEMMSYGHVYVARVAIGARPSQTVEAFLEAEAWPGPSLIIAYSPCVAHGYDLAHGAEQSKLAVGCGTWPLVRYDPRRSAEGLPPLLLDSPEPKVRIRDYMKGEARFRMVERQDPERFRRLQAAAETEAHQRFEVYKQLAGLVVPGEEPGAPISAEGARARAKAAPAAGKEDKQ